MFGGGGGGNVQLESASASINTLSKGMKKRQGPHKRAGGKENGYFNSRSSNSSTTSNSNSNKSNNSIKKTPTKTKKKGWGLNNKNKKKNKGKNNHNNNRVLQETKQAPKLSIFLQQAEENDDHSLNHTIDTGSLTASLTTASLVSAGGTCPKSGLDASNSDSSNTELTHPYVRPLTPPDSELYQTRPRSAAGVVPPPLHESFPMDGVTELSDSNSAIDALEALETMQSLSASHDYHDSQSESPVVTTPLHHQPYDSASVDNSSGGGSAERSDGTDSTVEAADLSPNQVSPLHKTLANSNARNNRVIVELSPPLYHEREGGSTASSENDDDQIGSAVASLESSEVSSVIEDEDDGDDEKFRNLLMSGTSTPKADLSTRSETQLSAAERAKSILDRYRQQREELQKKSSNDSIAEESISLSIKSEDESVANINQNMAVSFDNSSMDLEELLIDVNTDKVVDDDMVLDKADDEEEDNDFLTAVDSEHAIDSGSIGDDSANADLSHDTSENLSLEQQPHQQQLARMEFDLDFVIKGGINVENQDQNGQDMAQVSNEFVETRDDVKVETEVEVKVETKTTKTDEFHKSFEDIIREVEETIANSQKENSWISNGLLSSLEQQQQQDDSSVSQHSIISFNSEEFKEDEVLEDSGHNSSIVCRDISTIIEEHEHEDCDVSLCPIDAAMERGKIQSQQCNRIEKEAVEDQGRQEITSNSPRTVQEEQEMSLKLPQTTGSSRSFDSYEFREDEIEEENVHDSSQTGVDISTIVEDQEDETSHDPIDAVMKRDELSSNELDDIVVSASSFTSDEFKEDEIEESTFHSSGAGLDMVTIVEEQEGEVSNGSIDIIKEVPSTEEKDLTIEMTKSEPPSLNTPSYGKLQDQSTEPSTVAMGTPSMPSYPISSASNETTVSLQLPSQTTLTRYDSSDSQLKSALLSKNIPKPTLKKSVSWKDKTDVFTYLPPQAQDLQKARDLVSTYEKIMKALNTRCPDTAESKDNDDRSSSSDADLSETSGSSLDSLLSILSGESNESIKEALEQIAQETVKLASQEELVTEEEKENARTQLLENSFQEINETNASSSSFESLLSVISSNSSNSNQSMKQVVKKLKEEAEMRIIFCSKQLEEARLAAMKEQEVDSIDSSLTSSSLSSAASSTDTSESVKALMTKLKTERSRQAEVFTSTNDMFSLIYNRNQKEEARVQIVSNNWVDGLSIGSSSSLSSLLSASPNSSLSTTESSESVQYMMRTLKTEKERHRQRRNKIRSVKSFVDSMCCIPSASIIPGSPERKRHL